MKEQHANITDFSKLVYQPQAISFGRRMERVQGITKFCGDASASSKGECFFKKYIMNLAKGTTPKQVLNSAQGQHNGNNLWKTNKAGPTTIRNGKKFEWYTHHNKHVTHKPSACYLNPSHPKREEMKKQIEE